MKHEKSTRQRPQRGRTGPGPVARGLAGAVALSLALSGFPAAAQNSQTMVTPNYRDVDLGQIVEAVSQVTGRNFIIDPRVKAQVTMLSATPMSPAAFYEAFLAILQVHGFVAVPSGNVIKIIPDANARQVPANDLPDRVSATSDEIVTQVVILKNVSAAQLVPILRPLIPQYGHLAAYPASNALIISDRANNVNRMIRIIDRIDRASDDEVEVVRLENASAAEVVRVVNALNQGQAAAEGGAQVRLVADDRTNSVLLGGEKSQRLRLRALIAHLDTPLETGGDTQVRYLKYADAEKIATALKQQLQGGATPGAGGGGAAGAAGAGAGAAGRDTVIWADPATNALVVTAPPKVMRELMTVVDKLDIRRAQVLVEAIIVEVSGDQNADLGVNWLIDGSRDDVAAGGFVSPVGGVSIGDVVQAVQDPESITSVPNGLSVGVARVRDVGTNFAALIRAIRGDANTNIISTPSTLTLDNQEAQIKVAQEVPFLTGQFSSAQGGNQTPGVVNPFQTIQRQDVGTILKITPQITDDATVLMKIEIEASSLASAAVGAVDLITNKRTITTNVLAGDGEIIVLGGLISDQLRESEQRVPFLGKVPVLGELFKTRSTSKAKTNLMVFIRPKVLLDSESMAIETGAKYNYLRGIQQNRNKGRAQLLPGQRQPQLPSLEELQPAQAPEGVRAVNPSTGMVPTVPGAGASAPVIVTPGASDAAAGGAEAASSPPAGPQPGTAPTGAPGVVIVTPGAAGAPAATPPPANRN